MTLHEDPKLFGEAVRATAQQMGMLDIYVEKDYWVTRALQVIFSSPIGNELVFKGGTALSKCYGLIERFSEDIDLVILQTGDKTGAQLKKKLKAVSLALDTVMPEVELPDVTNKRGMIRKTAHEYPKAFVGNYGQVRDKIVLESSLLGHYEPHHERMIHAFINEMMFKTSQEKMIETYHLEPFAVRVLDVKERFAKKY
jgi:predicted nucleotidyltransferase component of viral defense system